MEYALQTFNLDKTFKGKKVLSNISMNVPRGSIYGLVGRNGAGKTTLMRVVSGLVSPNNGGYRLLNSDDFKESHKRVGILIEKPGVYGNLTALQNIEYFQRLYCNFEKEISKEISKEILEMVELDWRDKTKVKNFSLGMKQRLGIAIALIGNPDFLILDEPINGLDPKGVYEIRKLLLKLNEEKGITILISSHILSELFKLATNYGIIENGRLIEELTKEQLEEKCRKCIKIKIDKEDINKAIEVIETKLNITDYDVLPDNIFRIFNDNDIAKINIELAKEDIRIYSLSYNGEEIEEYFMEKVEGEK